MSNKTKLKIGEFSQMMQVTVKTLRHYEQKGMLLPDEVDEVDRLPLYRRKRLQSRRQTPHIVHRRRVEPRRPRKMGFGDSDTNRISY